MEKISEHIVENELWPEDFALFESMKDHYYSEREKLFFDTMYRKMLSEYAPCGELLLSPRDNDEKIGFHREEYDEFIVGHITNEDKYESIHVMKLSEALCLNLKELGYISENKTMLEWLRERDYSEVTYDHNKAYL